MRLRKKKHLEQRLAQCQNTLLARSSGIEYVTMQNSHDYIDYQQVFGNDNAIVLELGCGMGAFATTFARQHKDINILAVEKITNVIIHACEKTYGYEDTNIKYLNIDAKQLPYFIPPHSISAIYLNFSCPYPKSSYANNRLTHISMLDIYRELLIDGGAIIQKTDNTPFFHYSLDQYQHANMQVIEQTDDLYTSQYLTGNIATEYETKFVSQGKNIHYAKVICNDTYK